MTRFIRDFLQAQTTEVPKNSGLNKVVFHIKKNSQTLTKQDQHGNPSFSGNKIPLLFLAPQF